MRKILFILCGMLLFLSCHDKSVYKEPDTDVELLKPYKDLEVIVPEGYASIVKLYGDTLAICPYTTTISIPNLASVSRASFPDAITIENVRNENNFYKGELRTWQVVAFEDSRNGDYDYHDLIIHVKWIIQKDSYTVSVQPIALGSTKTIKLGFEKMEGNINNPNEVIVAEDCRGKLFGGKEGFINTYGEKDLSNMNKFKYTENLKKQSDDLRCAVNWFIEVDGGVRLYAITNNKKCLDQNGIPYGLIFTSIHDVFKYCNKNGDKCGLDWFLYPQERVSIRDVYDFDEYIKTGDISIFRTPKNGYFDAIGDGEPLKEGLLYCPNSLYNIE